MNQDNSEFSYVQPYSTNSGKSDSFMDKMKMMMMKMKMKDMMRSNYQDNYDMDKYRTGSYRKNDPMSQFKQMFNSYRSKRQATDSLDLGDRLVEKLAEQKHQMEAKIGNLTCVLRETNAIDASNNLDLQAMKREMKLCMNQDIKNKVESNFGPMEELLQQTQ